MTWRSACRGCTAVHDLEHKCCRRAVENPATTGLYPDERSPPLAEACILEDSHTRLRWPVLGSDELEANCDKGYRAARRIAVIKRNGQLKLRVGATACCLFVTAKILLRGAREHARLPLEIRQNIVAHIDSPELTAQ